MMSQTELIPRLEELAPSFPEGCFVLLWSYFESHGLAAAERYALSLGISPLDIEPYWPKAPSFLESWSLALEELRGVHGEAVDYLAVRLLKGLDRLLNDRNARRLEPSPLPGIKGSSYRLRRRNNYLADYFHPGVTSAKDQSRSLHTHTRFHKAIPAEPVGDYEIDCRPETSWGDRKLHLRLLDERARLRVLLWPLQTVLDYPALDSFQGEELPQFVSLDSIRNEADLLAEIRDAIALAGKERATLLIFPELAIPTQTDLEIRSLLASHDAARAHPILTLYGLCHQKSPGGDLDVNEAVLLGPDGREIHRHTKLSAFTFFSPDRTRHSGERVDYGTAVAVLECALGNLTPLICLDLFHEGVDEVLRRSHSNIFPVPSLSPTTGAHRTAAKQLQATNLASTFLCNRWITGPVEEGTSFYQIPRQERGYQPHLPAPQGTPYLLFQLG